MAGRLANWLNKNLLSYGPVIGQHSLKVCNLSFRIYFGISLGIRS